MFQTGWPRRFIKRPVNRRSRAALVDRLSSGINPTDTAVQARALCWISKQFCRRAASAMRLELVHADLSAAKHPRRYLLCWLQSAEQAVAACRVVASRSSPGSWRWPCLRHRLTVTAYSSMVTAMSSERQTGAEVLPVRSRGEAPLWVRECGDEVSRSWSSLLTSFRDFDCRNDQHLKISHISSPDSWPVCFAVGLD